MLRDIVYYTQVLLEAAVGVIGIRPYEEPRYAVLATLPDGVEIRRYAPRLAAQVAVPADGAAARNEAFRILFRYITGGNVAAEKIEMTVPVATNARTEKIAMTVPVESASRDGGLQMQFFLPARYTAQTAPRPADERIRIVPVAEETVAVLRFSGRGTAQELARREAELLEALATTAWRPAGDPAILFYDAPSTLPFLRRNEAAVRVDRR
ncbi:MAG: heme-binding protein [Candidatus Rokubacteria bacterium]|nr:heme-binding protein [Candidatus Rokubacteria bacterium]